MGTDDRQTFPRSLRITTTRQFQTVYDAGVSTNVGPLRVHGRPNALGHPRLGMAVSRRVGNAVVRNRNKRLLREAFRLVQHELPGEYDLVISVRPHEPLRLDDYRNLLLDAARRLDGIWNKRQRRDNREQPPNRG